MNVDSVSPEELEAAISYYTQALDDPKRVMEAAATLPYMLYAMGLVGVYPERIKALAELTGRKNEGCGQPAVFLLFGNRECFS